MFASPPNILFLMCDSMDGRVIDPGSPVKAVHEELSCLLPHS